MRKGNNWFTKKWAWDTTGTPPVYNVPVHKDRTQEGYYSIFQIDYLNIVLQEMTLQVHLDAYLNRNDEESIDWQNNGLSWMQYAESRVESLSKNDHIRSVAALCQFVSNRYYPKTQSDQRTIRVGGSHYSDHWICVYGHDWDWYEEAKTWNPQIAEDLFDLTPEKVRHAYEGLAVAQGHCDPLERWHQLTQFVSVDERKKLKGDALRAETLRAGTHMLRFLYKDLYGEELPRPNEVTGKIVTHIPELEVRKDPRRYLEFVVNRFGLNPQPKLSLIVEGQSEEVAVRQIFEEYFGAHPGTYGIEIVVLSGVGAATGKKKEDRFQAILRLIDYLHYHQTISFLILDNENYAERLKQKAQKAKSIHNERRYVTRPEYIRIWKESFEFDNFSNGEIAAAMNELAQGRARIISAEVANCKKDPNPGTCLNKLYHQKTNYDLEKIKLSEILVVHMLSPDSRRKIVNRPIIKVLERVVRLAARNPLPTMHKIWEENQASKYLGKKRKPVMKRRGV